MEGGWLKENVAVAYRSRDALLSAGSRDGAVVSWSAKSKSWRHKDMTGTLRRLEGVPAPWSILIEVTLNVLLGL